MLVDVDRFLAENAIKIANSTSPRDPKNVDKIEKEIRKALEHMANADKELLKEHFDHAIQEFRKAWEHAQHAIKFANEPSTLSTIDTFYPNDGSDVLHPSLCGNRVVDEWEICDKAIAQGLAGACPTACSDDNECTDNIILNASTCEVTCQYWTKPDGNSCTDGFCESGACTNYNKKIAGTRLHNTRRTF